MNERNARFLEMFDGIWKMIDDGVVAEDAVKKYIPTFVEKEENIINAMLAYFEREHEIYDNFDVSNGVSCDNVINWLHRQRWIVRQKTRKGKDVMLDVAQETTRNNGNCIQQETMFNQGDYIVRTTEEIRFVRGVSDDGHYLIQDCETDGVFECKFDLAHALYHHWTIKDAKKGDVLVSNKDEPFIFSGVVDNGYMCAYCGISHGNYNSQFVITDPMSKWIDGSFVHPANVKDKRKLFDIMEKYGYRWNGYMCEAYKYAEEDSQDNKDSQPSNKYTESFAPE